MAASKRLFYLPRLEVRYLILMYIKSLKNEIKSKARFLPSLACMFLEGWRVGRNSLEWSSGKENGLLKMLTLWVCFLFSGTSRNAQQFLAMCDRGETSQGVKYTGTTWNYRSLPHCSRTDASWGPWSEANQHIGARFLTTPGCKTQLTHSATLPERHQGLHVPHAQSWGGLLHSPSHPPIVHPVSLSSNSLHVPLRSAWNLGPVPGSRAPGPRRVDMPPDDDWRQSSCAPQSGHRRIGGQEFLFVLADAPGRKQIRARALQHSRW